MLLTDDGVAWQLAVHSLRTTSNRVLPDCASAHTINPMDDHLVLFVFTLTADVNPCMSWTGIPKYWNFSDEAFCITVAPNLSLRNR
jgi:hypothetical protein